MEIQVSSRARANEGRGETRRRVGLLVARRASSSKSLAAACAMQLGAAFAPRLRLPKAL